MFWERRGRSGGLRGLGGQEERTGVSYTCAPAMLHQCETSDISPLPALFDLLISFRTPAYFLGSMFSKRIYFLWALKVYVALCYKGRALKLGILSLSPLHTHRALRETFTGTFSIFLPHVEVFFFFSKKDMGKNIRGDLGQLQVSNFAE